MNHVREIAKKIVAEMEHMNPLTIPADRKYWEEFGDAIGWKLSGWTGRRHAGFLTGRQQIELPGFSITGYERDAIMAAIKKGGK
jgi:hypothetical protein